MPLPATQDCSENKSNNIGIWCLALWNMCLYKCKKTSCTIFYSKSNISPPLWCYHSDNSTLCPVCQKFFLLWLVRIQNMLSPTGPLEIVQPSALQWFYFLCLLVSSHACTGVIHQRLKGTHLHSMEFSLYHSLLSGTLPMIDYQLHWPPWILIFDSSDQ